MIWRHVSMTPRRRHLCQHLLLLAAAPYEVPGRGSETLQQENERLFTGRPAGSAREIAWRLQRLWERHTFEHPLWRKTAGTRDKRERWSVSSPRLRPCWPWRSSPGHTRPATRSTTLNGGWSAFEAESCRHSIATIYMCCSFRTKTAPWFQQWSSDRSWSSTSSWTTASTVRIWNTILQCACSVSECREKSWPGMANEKKCSGVFIASGF